MSLNIWGKAALILACLFAAAPPAGDASTALPPPPQPVAVFMGPEFYETGGKQWTRYRFAVVNRSEYPNEMFAPAPELPPCGANTKSSRTWVELYEQGGKRLYGFCNLGSRDGLGQLWFALERNVVPPSWVYVEMHDRKTNTKYKSNLVETVD